MNQVELHKKIENVISGGISGINNDIISKLVEINMDAKDFFFSRADAAWLMWLWENGFLDAIKEKPSDFSQDTSVMPELQYLDRMADLLPNVVTEIICSFKVSPQNYNFEVVRWFLRICNDKLPAINIKKIVPKIKNEKWIILRGDYVQYGFEFKDMFKKLNEANDFESILILAEAVTATRDIDTMGKREKAYLRKEMFYVHDLSETGIFSYLAESPKEYWERSLLILTNAFAKVIAYEGSYMLMDEDFFTLRLSSVLKDTYEEEYRFLTASIIEIARKIFSDDELDKRVVYEKIIDILPESNVSRRFRLFLLSLRPDLFVDELKIEYFRLFSTEKILDVLYGAEYERLLMAGFSQLGSSLQREYVLKVMKLFGDYKDDKERTRNRHYGSCILSSILKSLTPEEKEIAQKKEFVLDSEYQPEPSIGKITGGTVVSKSPVKDEDFKSFSIEEIVKMLKSELSPQELQKKYKDDNFLNPRDADGVVIQLKKDIKDRTQDYLNNSKLFFDRDILVPHYTNAFLQGVKESLSEKRENKVNWVFKDLIELFLAIKESGEKSPFDKNTSGVEKGRWFGGWLSVHMSIADLLEELIKQHNKVTILNFKQYREKVLMVINYLFGFDDPIPEDEKLKTATMTVKSPGESEYQISDPFSIAINSVRGRAFQVLLYYVYQEASNFENIKLSNEVKSLFDSILKKEKTRAIMFMFGHYLPSFYFRDMMWTRSRFNDIFNSKDKDKYLQMAVWEGYLSNNLYRELFFEPYIQSLYGKNITTTLVYPRQKFFKDPHESLGVHFALAFFHYKEFGFNNKLLKMFLEFADEKQLSEFIGFLGGYITKDKSNALKEADSAWRVNRVKKFWGKIIKTKEGSPALRKFGTWIDTDNNVFDVKWLAHMVYLTLKVTDGLVDWNYGLMKSIDDFAKFSPRDALRILEIHLMRSVNNDHDYIYIQEDREWYLAFKILYADESKKIRSDTKALIGRLIENGGRKFWILENIIKTND